jgi:hypothetical protein
MVSLSNVKAYLRISDTDATRDALISLLIPVVYADIIAECNNFFRMPDSEKISNAIYFDVTGSVYRIMIPSGFSAMGWPTGGTLIVSSSRLNDGLFTIAAQADTYITTVEPIVDEVQTTAGYTVRVDLCNFPRQLESIASDMIGYKLATAGSDGITSMSLGNYSESRAVSAIGRGGYPDSILSRMPNKCMRTGRGTIQWHINENRTYWPQGPSSHEGA